MKNLYLIRHGQASYGTDDYDRLSRLGTRQSELLGTWFKQCGIEVNLAITGSLKRHVQTADAFFEAYDGPGSKRQIHCHAGFNELDQVDVISPTFAVRQKPVTDAMKTMSFDDFHRSFEPAYYRWISGEHDHEYREAFPAFRGRCLSALGHVADITNDNDNVVAFTSGGTMAMICRELMKFSDEATQSLMWRIQNAAVSHLVQERGKLAVVALNSVAHLEQFGDPMLLTIS